MRLYEYTPYLFFDEIWSVDTECGSDHFSDRTLFAVNSSSSCTLCAILLSSFWFDPSAPDPVGVSEHNHRRHSHSPPPTPPTLSIPLRIAQSEMVIVAQNGMQWISWKMSFGPKGTLNALGVLCCFQRDSDGDSRAPRSHHIL